MAKSRRSGGNKRVKKTKVRVRTRRPRKSKPRRSHAVTAKKSRKVSHRRKVRKVKLSGLSRSRRRVVRRRRKAPKLPISRFFGRQAKTTSYRKTLTTRKVRGRDQRHYTAAGIGVKFKNKIKINLDGEGLAKIQGDTLKLTEHLLAKEKSTAVYSRLLVKHGNEYRWLPKRRERSPEPAKYNDEFMLAVETLMQGYGYDEKPEIAEIIVETVTEGEPYYSEDKHGR